MLAKNTTNMLYQRKRLKALPMIIQEQIQGKLRQKLEYIVRIEV